MSKVEGLAWEEQQVMVQVLESLTPTMETWRKLLFVDSAWALLAIATIWIANDFLSLYNSSF